MKTIIRCLFICSLLSSQAQAVVMGNTAGVDDYSSVGSIITGAGGLGSFVAISETWVLTAAHVVDDGSQLTLVGGHPDGPAGEVFFFPFFDTLNNPRVIIHPDYVPGEFHDDLALVELSPLDPILPALHAISYATFSSVPLPGTLPPNATVTGYGQAAIGDDTGVGTRRFVSTPTTTADPFETVGVTPFPTVFPTDCGGGAIHCVYGTVGGAPGDSGGGIFASTGAGQAVTGINSFIFDENDLDPTVPLDWTNGYWTVGTSVAAYEAWIKNPETGVSTNANFSAAAFVPIPPAVLLLGSSLVGLFAVSRKTIAAQPGQASPAKKLAAFIAGSCPRCCSSSHG